jgi:hypothetical protein
MQPLLNELKFSIGTTKMAGTKQQQQSTSIPFILTFESNSHLFHPGLNSKLNGESNGHAQTRNAIEVQSELGKQNTRRFLR